MSKLKKYIIYVVSIIMILNMLSINFSFAYIWSDDTVETVSQNSTTIEETKENSLNLESGRCNIDRAKYR